MNKNLLTSSYIDHVFSLKKEVSLPFFYKDFNYEKIYFTAIKFIIWYFTLVIVAYCRFPVFNSICLYSIIFSK